MTLRAPIRWALAGLVLMALPSAAEAHLVDTRLGDFYGGMIHPLTGVEDIVPWFALAILAAFQGPARARWFLVAFPVGLIAGAALSLAAPGLPVPPVVSIAVIAATGLCVAAAVRLPTVALVVFGTAIAVLHGYHNGQAMTETTDRLLFISGLTAIGYVFTTLLTALAVSFLRGGGEWRPIALRASGSWVAAVGIMTFGMQMRGLA